METKGTGFDAQLKSALDYADEGGGLGCFNAVAYEVYRHIETGRKLQLPSPSRMMGEAAISAGYTVGDVFKRTCDGRIFEVVTDGVGPFARDVTPTHVKTPGELEQDRLWAEHNRLKYRKNGNNNRKYQEQARSECDHVGNLNATGKWAKLRAMLQQDLTPLARRLIIDSLMGPRSPYRDDAAAGTLK